MPGDRGSGLDELISDIRRWMTDAASGQATLERLRAHWLRARADEQATFAGLLVDMVERSSGASLTTSSGRTYRGRLVALGRDFVALGVGPSGGLTFVRTDSVTCVRPGPGEPDPEPTGHRSIDASTTFADVLVAVAADRRRVLVCMSNGQEPLRGELRAAGVDVLTLTSEAAPPVTTYVQLRSVSELSVLGSG